MNMLPNDHHPGPRCSCAECLLKYPDIQPPSNSLCWQLRDWFSGTDPDSIGTQLAVMAAEQLEHLQRLVARVTEWDPMMPVEASLFDELRAAAAGAECLRKYPDAQPPSNAMSLEDPKDGLRDLISDAATLLERDGRLAGMAVSAAYIHEHCGSANAHIDRLQRKVADLELIKAEIRAVIAEMIHVAADGDRDADWTADNCAQIDAWQVRLADAVAGLPPRRGRHTRHAQESSP